MSWRWEHSSPWCNKELHRLAESPVHTLQTTAALVNEAYLRLVDVKKVSCQNRAHFFGVSAQLVRQILVDLARSRRALKRGGNAYTLSLEEALTVSPEPGADLVALDDTLKALASIDPRRSRVVELRFFGGLSVEEAAEVLKVSPETVMHGSMKKVGELRSSMMRVAGMRICGARWNRCSLTKEMPRTSWKFPPWELWPSSSRKGRL
jgi:RNA polymerase sigma factor (TIGR02999 family)